MQPPLEITIGKTTDEIDAMVSDRIENGFGASLEIYPRKRRVWEALENGADDIILHSSDGAVYLATVQDWEADHGCLVIELR